MWIVLLFIGLLLIIINAKALKKENNDNFNEVLKGKSLETKDYQVEFLKLKDDYEKTKMKLENNIKDLQLKIDKLNNCNKLEKNVEKNKNEIKKNINNFKMDKVTNKVIDNKSNEIKNNSNGIKVLEIKKLLKDGFTIDEVAEKLDIGKGEVLLIKDLYIK